MSLFTPVIQLLQVFCKNFSTISQKLLPVKSIEARILKPNQKKSILTLSNIMPKKESAMYIELKDKILLQPLEI